eukprot:gene10730-14390_t
MTVVGTPSQSLASSVIVSDLELGVLIAPGQGRASLATQTTPGEACTMATTVRDDRPLTLDDLTGWFASGSKPASEWRVGAEHEKFGFHLKDHSPVQYGGPDGIEAMLKGLMRFGWEG